MKKRQQYPCFLIKDEQGNVTNIIVQDTNTGEKMIYKVETISFEELGDLIK